jgi:ankyrin repeat protein
VEGETALMFAVQHGHLDCARVLLEFGADKDATNDVREKSVLYFVCIRFENHVYLPAWHFS